MWREPYFGASLIFCGMIVVVCCARRIFCGAIVVLCGLSPIFCGVSIIFCDVSLIFCGAIEIFCGVIVHHLAALVQKELQNQNKKLFGTLYCLYSAD